MPAAFLPLRILARPAFSSVRSNPYTSLLYSPLVEAGHQVVEYQPHRACLGKWDVVHVHWPESVFNHTLAEARVTTESLLFCLSRARARGAKVVWTVHNLRAHERRHVPAENRFRSRFLQRLDGIVALSEPGLDAATRAYPELQKLPAWVVPHPHYRGRYSDDVTRADARRRLDLPARAKVVLNFGRAFGYKNLPALFSAAAQKSEADWVVLVAGRPRSAELAQQLRRAGERDSRIRLDFDFIPDERVQLYFRAADLVVLPYREILNSGTALLALSFDRSVLLPEVGAGQELARRVGGQWVHTYRGELSGADIERALERAASQPERTDGAHLDEFSTNAVSDKLLSVFRELCG